MYTKLFLIIVTATLALPLDAAQKSKTAAEIKNQTDLQQNFLGLEIDEELTRCMWEMVHSYKFELIQEKLSEAEYDYNSIIVLNTITTLIDDALSGQLQKFFEECRDYRPDLNAVDKSCKDGRLITYARNNEFYKVRDLLEKYGARYTQ